MPGWYMGQFVVDDSPMEAYRVTQTVIHLTVPTRNEEGAGRDKLDSLCKQPQILTHLRETTGKFDTVNKLTVALRRRGPHHQSRHLSSVATASEPRSNRVVRRIRKSPGRDG